MIVRELFARLGIKQDTASFTKADQDISKLKTALGGLAAILVSGAVASGLQGLVEDASDVAETTNILTKVFQDNAAGVEKWADVMGRDMGRSRFQLRQMAADIGKVIQPMIGSRKAAAEMSMGLAQAAIDQASLNNETDPRALQAMISGIVGMSRPLLAFGVNLNIASLEAFALSRGITKSVNEMTPAEKITLRYEAIIAQSANSIGDAADTSEQYANATKALRAALRDLGILVGQALLPGVERFLVFARDTVRALEELLQGTRFLEVALFGLGVMAAIVGVKMLLPFLPAIAVALALAAAFAIVAAVIEDIIQFFTGGRSLIGRVLEGWGINTEALRKSFEKLWIVAKGVFSKIGEIASKVAEKLKPHFGKALDAISAALGRFVNWAVIKFEEFADSVGPVLDSFLEFDVDGAIAGVSKFFSEFVGKIQAFVKSPAGRILTALLGAYLGRKFGGAAGAALGEAGGKLVGSLGIPGTAAAGGFLGKHGGGLLGSLSGLVGGGLAALKATSGILPQTATAPTAAVGAVNFDTGITITVQAQPGQNEQSLAETLADTIDRRLADKYKEALQAVTPAKAAVVP